jgi:hypothetical protein
MRPNGSENAPENRTGSERFALLLRSRWIDEIGATCAPHRAIPKRDNAV